MSLKFEQAMTEKKSLIKLFNLGMISLFLSYFCGPLAQAKAVKHDRTAAKGCISRLSYTEALRALERFNLTTVNGTKEEIAALGTGLVWLEELNDGRPLDMATYRGANKYPFIFRNKGTHSQQTPAGIIISRRGAMKFGSNVAQLIHELGHLVGNQGGYGDYYRHVGKAPCVVSGYSDDRFNEQFAEVFAAFVTKPTLIKNNPSTACKKAWNYFSNVMFSSGENAIACMRGKANELIARRGELGAINDDGEEVSENGTAIDESETPAQPNNDAPEKSVVAKGPTQLVSPKPIEEFDQKRREEEYQRSIEEAIALMLRETTEYQPLEYSDDE